MKRNILKTLSGLLLMLSLLIIPANAAVSPGWHKHCEVLPGIDSWEYVFSDGTFATGWQYIDRYWYHFGYVDCSSEVGRFTYNSKINAWVGGRPCTIDGKDYYFNTDSQLLVNTNIVQGSGCFVSHLDSNGQYDDSFEPYSLRY